MHALLLSALLAAAPAAQARVAPAAGQQGSPAEAVEQSAELLQELEQAAEPSPMTGPRTGQDVLSARVPSYPNAPAPVRVGDTLEAHGVPMNIQSFTTPDDPRKVLDFYKGAFASMHLPMLGDGDLLVKFPYPSITVVDPDKQVNISVIAIRDAQHPITTVLLALADMQAFQDNVHRAIDMQYGGLPPYPGGEVPHTVVSTDGERQHKVVSFTTPDAPEKVQAYYRDALGKQGFREVGSANPGELGFLSKDAAWQFVIRRDPKNVRTVVMATWGDRVASEELQ